MSKKDDVPKAFERELDLKDLKDLPNGSYLYPVGFVDANGVSTRDTRFVYVPKDQPAEALQPAQVHVLDLRVTRSCSEFHTIVDLLGKPYYLTRFTDHDGTGWSRFRLATHMSG